MNFFRHFFESYLRILFAILWNRSFLYKLNKLFNCTRFQWSKNLRDHNLVQYYPSKVSVSLSLINLLLIFYFMPRIWRICDKNITVIFPPLSSTVLNLYSIKFFATIFFSLSSEKYVHFANKPRYLLLIFI